MKAVAVDLIIVQDALDHMSDHITGLHVENTEITQIEITEIIGIEKGREIEIDAMTDMRRNEEKE